MYIIEKFIFIQKYIGIAVVVISWIIIEYFYIKGDLLHLSLSLHLGVYGALLYLIASLHKVEGSLRRCNHERMEG